ncbi:MAG: hypothetical protein IPJ30_16260 [Acidobacteria bacterium]|nr:hypothetical protein [Acidobacteriota bacterium]
MHHAAFDANILGITPDLVAEIRDDILEEIDGPMLQHGLKEMHRTRIITPFRSSEKPTGHCLRSDMSDSGLLESQPRKHDTINSESSVARFSMRIKGLNIETVRFGTNPPLRQKGNSISI